MKLNFILLLILCVLGRVHSGTATFDGPLDPDDTIEFTETPAGLKILTIIENEIIFEIEAIPGKRYLFGFSTTLKKTDWGIEGMNLAIENVEYIEESLGLFRFVPLEDKVIGTVTFTDHLPPAVFFKCFTTDAPFEIPEPTGTLP